MEVTKTDRGFELIEHPMYPPDTAGSCVRLVQQSSAIATDGDEIPDPGTSYLWIGDDHHLNRDEVRSLVAHLRAWLTTGSLKIAEQPPAEERQCFGYDEEFEVARVDGEACSIGYLDLKSVYNWDDEWRVEVE